MDYSQIRPQEARGYFNWFNLGLLKATAQDAYVELFKIGSTVQVHIRHRHEINVFRNDLRQFVSVVLAECHAEGLRQVAYCFFIWFRLAVKEARLKNDQCENPKHMFHFKFLLRRNGGSNDVCHSDIVFAIFFKFFLALKLKTCVHSHLPVRFFGRTGTFHLVESILRYLL